MLHIFQQLYKGLSFIFSLHLSLVCCICCFCCFCCWWWWFDARIRLLVPASKAPSAPKLWAFSCYHINPQWFRLCVKVRSSCHCQQLRHNFPKVYVYWFWWCYLVTIYAVTLYGLDVYAWARSMELSHHCAQNANNKYATLHNLMMNPLFP